MKNRPKYWKKLPGATLAEVLVMMIVAGIVFLGAMDGFGLFRRHTANITGRIVNNGMFYNGYYRLEDIVVNADSLICDGSGAVCWRNGREVTTIVLCDSMLVAGYSFAMDTLLRNVEALLMVCEPYGDRIDSLSAIVRIGDKSLTVAFQTARPIQEMSMKDIGEMEKEHEYE